MPSNQSIPIDEIIASIDNDFNLDNSDWIPRIAVWTIEALSQLDCLITEKKRIKANVKDRIAMLDCSFANKKFKVYDKNGCEVTELEGVAGCCGNNKSDFSTGKDSLNLEGRITKTLQRTRVVDDKSIVLGLPTGYSEYEYEGNKITLMNDIIGYASNGHSYSSCERNYIPVSDRQLELTFDTDYVYIEYEAPKTVKSEINGCELPVVPDNGILKEAIKYYCMYKILCRGVKHPVFNLAASQYGTNPFYLWKTMKDEAKRSVIIQSQGDVVNDKGEWGKALINFTFD